MSAALGNSHIALAMAQTRERELFRAAMAAGPGDRQTARIAYKRAQDQLYHALEIVHSATVKAEKAR